MAPPLSKVLVANRGEIARRIFAACRSCGIATVAVHSDPDAAAPFVTAADEAVPLGGTTAAESYLDIDAVLEAAARTGADAIHPGYGFLSENEDFARAVEAAGLTFIGPTPEAIEKMGLKDRAKAIMEKAGVPVVPGYHGADQDDKLLAGKASMIGYPLLIKAVAGGGGKGMRLVTKDAEFADQLAAAPWSSPSPSSRPGTIGTPAASISFRARTFDPIASIASGGGPIQTRPAAMTRVAKLAFSARKP